MNEETETDSFEKRRARDLETRGWRYMVKCDVDFREGDMHYHMFKDLTEALAYVEDVRKALNEIRQNYEIYWQAGKVKDDLLSALMVRFVWHFMEEKDKYDIVVKVDPRLQDITSDVFNHLMSRIRANYHEITDEDIKKVLELAFGKDELKEQR